MKRFLLLSVCLLLCACLLGACGQQGDSETPAAEGPAVQTETYTSGDKVSVEYLVVDGMADKAVQDALNENLQEFYLWQWMVGAPEELEKDTARYEGTATYVIEGDSLRATRTLRITEDGASAPEEDVSDRAFSLTTGE
jgi:hypothetical protein